MNRFTLLSLAGVLALCGCNQPDAESVGARETVSSLVTDTPSKPWTLEKAVAEGKCSITSVRTVPFDSRIIRFEVSCHVKNPPKIEIEPAWALTTEDGLRLFVTIMPGELDINLAGRGWTDVFATQVADVVPPQTELHWSRLPESDPLKMLLLAAARLEPKPSWNVMETAVLAVSRNLDFKTIRTKQYSAPQSSGAVIVLGEGRQLAPDSHPIDEARTLLTYGGFNIETYRLFQEADQANARALSGYARNKKDLQALDTLGYFRTRNEAFAVLSDVWRVHRDNKAARKEALLWLSPMPYAYRTESPELAAKARLALQTAASLETDENLLATIQRGLR